MPQGAVSVFTGRSVRTRPMTTIPAGSTADAPARSAPGPARGRARSLTGRHAAEGAIKSALITCAAFSIFTTFAIIVVLGTETIAFFRRDEVSLREFFFSLQWSPLLGAEKHFGIWPLVCGTLLVTGVAMIVAIPLGLMTAVFLSEYAPRRVRAILKPILEVLAGVPTVVYGFFALTVITPVLRHLHGEFDVYNVFSAGLAVGIMCLPIVCSISEDALQAVPRSLREGAYGLGGTKFDVSVRVVVPSALSGIVAASLLAVARAVGETMIVALAAGNLARLTLDVRDQAQTMTAYMVQIFLGDVSNFGVEYLSSYAVAAMLFVLTLIVTLLGYRIRATFREEYE